MGLTERFEDVFDLFGVVTNVEPDPNWNKKIDQSVDRWRLIGHLRSIAEQYKDGIIKV